MAGGQETGPPASWRRRADDQRIDALQREIHQLNGWAVGFSQDVYRRMDGFEQSLQRHEERNSRRVETLHQKVEEATRCGMRTNQTALAAGKRNAEQIEQLQASITGLADQYQHIASLPRTIKWATGIIVGALTLATAILAFMVEVGSIFIGG